MSTPSRFAGSWVMWIGAAERPQAGQGGPLAQFAAGDRQAPGEEESGQAAHPDSAHPDQVDVAQVLGGQGAGRT